MKHSFRWFGKKDKIKLKEILQVGVNNIVTALHDIPIGDVWDEKSIIKQKKYIEHYGLKWSVVESVPIHEDIFLQKGIYNKYINNYKKTIINLSKSGIKYICYNFMPILDWTRTDLKKKLPNGSRTLEFNKFSLIAFDLYVLKRKNHSYSKTEIKISKEYFKKLSSEEIKTLSQNIIAGLPGSENEYSLREFNNKLELYKNYTKSKLRENLIYFLKSIIPTAEKHGVFMCIHPDDPPDDLFNIPRIVSTFDDLKYIFKNVPSINNGLTFCTGSLGSKKRNNIIKIFNEYSNRVHFIHLRNIVNVNEKIFYESSHLSGSIDMYEIIKNILIEEQKRKKVNKKNFEIFMRPDHGLQILDDINKKINPGYSLLGRMKGLAELEGLSIAISKQLYQ